MSNVPILPQDLLKKLHGTRLTTKAKIQGHHKGSHRARRVGSSMDFSDYRAYHAGDDVRQIDWNVYARSEKYYIKRFLDEQEMRVQILLDGSKSMAYSTEKWHFACQLVAAIGYTVLLHDDRLHFSYVTDQATPSYKHKGGSGKQRLLKMVEQLPPPEMTAPFAKKAVENLVKGQTVLIVITDALEPIDELELLIRRLPSGANDIRLLQIIDEQEAAPEFLGDMELMDVETGQLINVTVSDATITKYQLAKAEHERLLNALCKKYGVSLVQAYVKDGISQTYFSHLKNVQWIM